MFIPLAPADPVGGAAFLIAGQLFGDALLAIYFVTETSLRQRLVPEDKLGRAAAVWKMGWSIAAPTGMLLGAVIADNVGIRQAMWCLVAGAIVAAIPLARARPERANGE